ncbi:hypothetical protein [Nocardioides acrostichi]|uniref:Uncharacterized protein n=1 Tax=Nocardioides acrostichi TaxID=2784339 RepID=A0A930V1R5_9ACTN|nr:hypothetical protein [Nocardioides acrostichi]MBF4162449.1 hypothetical protein [Nocardioides acrostichi]
MPDQAADEGTDQAVEDTEQQEEEHADGSLHEMSDDEVAEVEKEREERLDPENRPDNVEIDNTQRTFDPEQGMFTDSEGYDEGDAQYASPESEDPTQDGSDD